MGNVELPCAFKSLTISSEQHFFRGLSSAQRAIVHAPVVFRMSSSVFAPLLIAVIISLSVTFEQ